MKVDYVSFDMACTLFWEPGCDPRYEFRYVPDTLRMVINYLRDNGYRVETADDPWKTYLNVWNEIANRGPVRELWSKYILLRFLYRVGVEIDGEALEKIYTIYINERSKHFTLTPKIDLVLRYLLSRGYVLILTTGTTSHDLVRKILINNELDGFFKLVFSTQLVGIPKDDPRFYMELVDLLNTDPEKIVHIGDSLTYDINPATSVGLKTIYYGWRTWCRAVDPQPCITSLWELPHLL